MRLSRFVSFLLATFALASCGTYRGAGGSYQSGNGAWRTGSDYAQDPSTREYYLNENRTAPQYIPSNEFRLYWPVTPVKINRGFHPASDPNHDGIDLGGALNAPVLAAHEGVVIYAGRDFRGYGNMVMIEYSSEWATLYGHLNEILAREGQIVKPGDPIGGMGKTGHATGIHLHFELLHQHNPMDPLPVLSRGSKFARAR
jgi:murein DD-endopeptidase MepM/ murein hydrolase activator NlpD